MLEQFAQIGKDALEELKTVADSASLEQFRLKYLSRKGLVTNILAQIGKVAEEDRRAAGQLGNKIKNEVNAAFEQLKEKIAQTQHSKR